MAQQGTMEEQLIRHCAPTLAGMKSACLFSYFYKKEEAVPGELKTVNEMLNERGVRVEALIWRENHVLVYAYRPARLKEELEQPDAAKLLSGYGYNSAQMDEYISHLKTRLQNDSCFPHEIGLFLGYPVEDVKGFIENGGQNCQSCGIWKVYCDASEKEKLFCKLKRCTEVYLQVFSEGRSLTQMTVCTG